MEVPLSPLSTGSVVVGGGPLEVAAAATPPSPAAVTVEVAPAGGQAVDLTVYATAASGANVIVEQVTAPTTAPADLMYALNSGASKAVTATIDVDDSQYQAPPPPVMLSGGNDGQWSPPETARDTLVTALLTQLGKPPGLPAPIPALDQIAPNVFNLMCLPDVVFLDAADQVLVLGTAQSYCAAHEAFLIVDTPAPASTQPPASGVASPLFGSPTVTVPPLGDDAARQVFLTSDWRTGLLGPNAYNGAAYYPWLEIPNPVVQPGAPATIAVPPSGTVAGVYATTDDSRGVWTSPAGTTATMTGVLKLTDKTMNDAVNADLNSAGINCLRTFPLYGNVVWGARTLAGADLIESGWKYLSVRRLADFIEQSLLQSLRWAVFAPNGPTLWAKIALEVNAFMGTLYGQGAFQGATAAAAYQVVCDGTTTSQADILAGIVNCYVGFTPVEPAEFVVLNVQLNAAPPAAAS
ncbi:MAG: phage tail sheath subtilisin-like domain-containing protein, partial [Actinomycetota bacterium]|nr:phage tail sheath subtilisin-like domain-containing protein [Actinomycetota bacterium]